jgi:hypothetical protein
MTPRRRVASCGAEEARLRVEQAEAYLIAAELATGEAGGAWGTVAAGNAVLAGIAASDAICCLRIGERSRGEDHHEALALLARATPDGAQLAHALERLLGIKDQSHYGVELVSSSRARSAVRQANRLLTRAKQELERGR